MRNKITALLLSLATIAPLYGDEITWIALTPDNNLSDISNWSTDTVPTINDDAIFNSNRADVSTNPTGSTAPFTVQNIHFSSAAYPFVFSLNNQQLTLVDEGITGNQTGATFHLSNTTGLLNDQALFSGATGTSGSALFNITNTATSPSSVVSYQLNSTGPFSMSSNGGVFVTNNATDASTGSGGHTVGAIGSDQVVFFSTYQGGDNVTLSVTNRGDYLGSNSSASNYVGVAIDGQLFSADAFQAGDNLILTATNEGVNSSSGVGGNRVGTLLTSAQVYLTETCNLGESAKITLTNSGTNSCSSTSQDFVGYVLADQFFVGDSFVAQDDLKISAANIGIDSSSGHGDHIVADIDTQTSDGNQIAFGATCTVGNHAKFSAENSGTYSGSNISRGCSVGFMNNSQIAAVGPFEAQNNCVVTVTNTGVDSAIGQGGDVVGDTGAGQVAFLSSFSVEDHAKITITNSGDYTGQASTTYSTIGSCGGPQLQCLGDFDAGKKFELTVSNSGTNSGQGVINNFIGAITNSYQVQLEGAMTRVGDFARIEITNEGTVSNSGVSDNNVGYLGTGGQLQFSGDFRAGDWLNLSLSNSGSCPASGSGNLIGFVAGSQLNALEGFTVGDNATILVKNTSNAATTGFSNDVGLLGGSQLSFGGPFLAGANLSISVQNTMENSSDISNAVGVVGGSQILFQDTVSLNENSSIFASNTGSVNGYQIQFDQGFNVLSGKPTIQALNSGALALYGIGIFGNSYGGNVNIILENSTLLVNTSTSSFTIGELNGDNTSAVQSSTTLIIDTDANTNGDFAGIILDLATPTSFIKTGRGTQKISGSIVASGLILVDQGTLKLTGGALGDLTINSQGTLAGAGIVAGNVTNMGTIAPGKLTGALTITESFTNNNGDYDVVVDGTGHSDLILVGTTATLNGGKVLVSSSDGTYFLQAPYTILQAGSVNGQFSKALSFSPLLKPILSYDDTHVYLTLRTAIANAAETCSQLSVAERLDDLTHLTAGQQLLLSEMVDLTIPEAQEALDTLSGYQHADDAWTMQILSRQFIRRLYDPLRPLVTESTICDCSCDPCGLTGWFEGGGGFTRLRSRKNANGLDINSYEGTIGFQNTLCDEFTLGLAGGYEYDKINYVHGGSATNSTWMGGLYGLYRPQEFYALADLTYGYSTNKIRREIIVGPLEYTATSKPKLNQCSFYGEVGVDYFLSCFLVQPFGGVEVSGFWRNHLTENEVNGWGLDINKKEWTTASTRLGMHFSTHGLSDGMEVSVDVAWNRLLTKRRNTIGVSFQEFGGDFTARGISLDDNSIDYAVTVSKQLCEGINAYLEYTGESWAHATTYNALAGVTMSW